jgi:predicted extracellular nuclease
MRYFLVAVDDSANVTSSPSSSATGPLNTYFYTVRPNGATIMDIQFNPSASSDASPLENDTVTVNGVVTASFQTGDLGYLYIQDETATENAGIFVNGGPTLVFGLNRGDIITVEGVVEEAFGFTRLNAINVISTGTTGIITPIVVDPSDPILFGTSGSADLEKYESMLLRYENPMMGGVVNVTNPNLGFGDFEVASGSAATVGARVLTARQTLGQAQGSIDVSYSSDTAQYGAGLNVTPIQLTNSFSFDALEGVLFYAFGNFKLTPRNNADFVNVLVGIKSLTSNEVETSLFPNPAQNQINVQIDEAYAFDALNVQIVDLTGRVVLETQLNSALSTLNVEQLKRGMYLVRIANGTETIHGSKLILK